MKSELKRIWDFCDNEQRRLIEYDDESDFSQGAIIAYRTIQWEINKKCSDVLKEDL
jgi:hypothetical protein